MPDLLNLSLDHEAVQQQLCAALQVQIPNLDTNPGTNIRTFIETISAQLMLETSHAQQRVRYAIPIEDIGEHGGLAVAASMSYAASSAPPPLSPEMIYRTARTIEAQDQFRAEYQGTFAQRAAAEARDQILELEDRQIMETLEVQEQIRNSWGEQWGARRVTIPLFELAANPTIQTSEIRSRRFDLRSEPVPPIINFLIDWQDRKREAGRFQLAPDKTPPKTPPKTAWQWILEEEAA